jgi:hypothetical protein
MVTARITICRSPTLTLSTRSTEYESAETRQLSDSCLERLMLRQGRTAEANEVDTDADRRPFRDERGGHSGGPELQSVSAIIDRAVDRTLDKADHAIVLLQGPVITHAAAHESVLAELSECEQDVTFARW